MFGIVVTLAIVLILIAGDRIAKVIGVLIGFVGNVLLLLSISALRLTLGKRAA